MCIAYALVKGLAVVTKTEKQERMKENLKSMEVVEKLSNDDVQLIDTLNRDQRKFVDIYNIKWSCNITSLDFIPKYSFIQRVFVIFAMSSIKLVNKSKLDAEELFYIFIHSNFSNKTISAC